MCRYGWPLFNHRGATGGGGGGPVVSRGRNRRGGTISKQVGQRWLRKVRRVRLGPVRYGHGSVCIRPGTRAYSFLNRLSINVLTWKQSGRVDEKFGR